MTVKYLELSQLSKKFGGGRQVLEDFSLDVKEGEFLAVVGPSGSGKTTVLRIISGLIYPDGGKVLLRGKDITRIPPHKRNMGVVFQGYALFPHMNAWKNIAYPLTLRRIGHEDVTRQVNRLVELIGITGPQRFPHQLSGGEQQRVAIARALVYDPDILLLDEPFSALDARVRVTLRDEIMRIHRVLGKTIVLVTHDQEEAFYMSDRVAILSNNGTLEQVGTPQEVYFSPRTAFIAGFIGASTRLVLDRYDPSTGEAVWKERVRLRIPRESVFEENGIHIAFLRPNEIEISSDGIICQVLRRVFMGTDIRVFANLCGQEIFFDVDAKSGLMVDNDEEVSVKFWASTSVS